MFAPNAHAKLARLLRQAMDKFHHITCHDTEVQDNVIDELANELDKWDADLPQFLPHNDTAGSALLRPYLQQYELIQFARAHARLLIYRLSLDMYIPTTLDAHGSDCNCKTGYAASELEVSPIVFCALTIIFVYLSLHPNARNQKMFEAARRLCEFEQRLACTSDMAKRYMTILKIFWEKLREQVNKSDTAINANGDRMRQNNDARFGAAPSCVMTESQVDLNANSSLAANGDGISDLVQDKARGEGDNNFAAATESGLAEFWSFENWDIGLGFPSVEDTRDIYGLHNLPAADSNGSSSENVHLRRNGSGIQSHTELQSLDGSHIEILYEDILDSLALSFREC
ncbi:hypothetical protein V1525DRAFT_422793 [Lipomyces kononenkoae]|uniref:Uncharacterized protein n=1 Tax=Lipomyces kononenkoae TaxID=34357 RepID=A0ACC3SQ90_LIPKO